MRFFLLFSVLLTISSLSHGSNWCETDQFYYNLRGDQLIEIERRTEKKRIIHLEESTIGLYAYKQLLYYISYRKRTLWQFDPKTGERVLIFQPTIEDHKDPTDFPYKVLFWEDFAFLYSGFRQKIIKVGLRTKTVLGRHPLGEWVRRGYIHGNLGYFAENRADKILVFDLKTFKMKTIIPVGRSPKHMLGVGDRLYVSCQECERVYCIDLMKNEVVGKIVVGSLPTNLIAEGDHLYVYNRLDGTISDVDLKKYKVLQTIFLKDKPDQYCGRPLCIKKGIGYVVRDGGKEVLFIDLAQGQILTILNRGKYSYFQGGIFLTDTAMYLAEERVCSLLGEASVFKANISFLFSSLSNIEGITLDDGEFDFIQMTAYIQSEKFDKARKHFENALRCANPKAYAVAAYACLHGVWGCSTDLGLYVEYDQGADHEFYNKLCDLFTKTEEPLVQTSCSKNSSDPVVHNLVGWEFDVYLY